MSTNLATILVGLGYDLSALEKGAPEAFRLINQQSLGMSAEMKRASREGAESLRLIDEALGIHIARPITKILANEFPALAKGLSSVLGAGVFAGVAIAGVEFVDKIAEKIEKAQKAQEAWTAAIEKTENVLESVGDHYARQIAEASGSLSPFAKIAMSGADEAKKNFEQVFAALQDEMKKAAEASGPLNRSLAFIGEMLHETFTTRGVLELEAFGEETKKLGLEIEEAFRLDALNGTHNALVVLQRDYDMAKEHLQELQKQQAEAQAQQSSMPGFLPSGATGPSQQVMDAAEHDVRIAKAGLDIGEQQGVLDRQRAANELAEQVKKAGEAMQKLQGDMGADRQQFRHEQRQPGLAER